MSPATKVLSASRNLQDRLRNDAEWLGVSPDSAILNILGLCTSHIFALVETRNAGPQEWLQCDPLADRYL